MKATESPIVTDAGRAAWTRHLARDLFPRPVTPFSWTVLRGPADVALRQAYAELGAPVSATEPFWRLENRHVYLCSELVEAADGKLCGAAWLGRVAPGAPTGLRGRIQAGGAIKRAESRLQTVAAEAAGAQTRLSRWLTWVQGLRWSQADILQVMEELEPHAVAALQVWFLTRAALNAADAQLQARLSEWLPDLAPAARSDLYLGIEELPSVQAALAVTGASRMPAASPERLSVLARWGHRGPGEVRPDASRWGETPALFERLAGHDGAEARLGAAQMARREAERAVRLKLSSGKPRQFDELLGHARDAMRRGRRRLGLLDDGYGRGAALVGRSRARGASGGANSPARGCSVSRAGGTQAGRDGRVARRS